MNVTSCATVIIPGLLPGETTPPACTVRLAMAALPVSTPPLPTMMPDWVSVPLRVSVPLLTRVAPE